jgi:hypothetical protein
MAKFKRSIQSTGFRPEQVSEKNVSRLQEYSDRIIGALRDERDAVISNRNEIANAMEKNAQIESQQAGLNKQIQDQNLNTQLKAQQDLSARALKEYETRTKTTQQFYSTVADFSLTASKKLKEIEVERFKQKDAATAAEIMMMGDNHPAVKALKALKYESHIEEVDSKIKIAQAREMGADPIDADNALKQLNELGYQSKASLLKHIGNGWRGFLNQKLIDNPEASRNRALAQKLASEAYAEYEAINGISGQITALKQETGYLDDVFKVTQSLVDNAGRLEHEDNKQDTLQTFRFQLRNAKDSADAQGIVERNFQTLQSLFGFEGAHNILQETLSEVNSDGTFPYDLDGVAAARIGPKGEAWGVRWADRLEKAKATRVQGFNSAVRAEESNKEMVATKAFRDLEPALLDQLANAGPQDDLSILATAKAESQRKYGATPQALINLERQILQENKAESERKSAIVLEKIRSGLATQGDVYSIADPTLRAEAQTAYITATKVRKYGENYEATFKSIKSGAKQIMGDSLEGAASVEAEELNLVMQKNFADDYEQALRDNNGDTARALIVATEILKKDIREAKANVPGARYESESGPNNSKIFKGIVSSRAQSAAQKERALETLRDTIGSVGVSALDSPGIVGSEMDLRKISEANRTGQTLMFTPQMLLASQLLGISPIEVVNTAIATNNNYSQNKILPLTLDPSLQAVNDARPETQALFFNNATPMSVRRGAAELHGSALRDPGNMRGGSGNVEAFRAAIIGKESGGNYNAVNPDSGALGIGQVMPENVGPWTQRYLGVTLTPQEFLNDRAAQDAVVNGRFRDMLADQAAAGYKGEEAIRRAAAVWYSGDGNLWNYNKPEYYNGRRYPSIAEYTKAIWDAYRR